MAIALGEPEWVLFIFAPWCVFFALSAIYQKKPVLNKLLDEIGLYIAMASFDFVDSASKSYRFVWEKRAEVMRLSAMVLTLKILIFVSFVAFGLEDQVLRHGLYLLPAYLLEGWVIAQLMLMALYSLEKEGGSKKKIMPPPEDFERNVKACMIVYVLTKLTLSFVVGMTFSSAQGLPEQPPSDPRPETLILAFMMLIFAVWSFRFFWLYVPLIIGKGPTDYLLRFRAFSSSFYMIGVWVLCFVPMVLLMIFVSEFFAMVLGVLGVGNIPIVADSVIAVIQAVIDYGISLVSSLGVAYGVYSVYAGEEKTTSIW